MLFNDHSSLKNQHAFLSPSSSHWLNYDLAKLDTVYLRMQTVKRGTELHELAAQCIRLGVKLPRSNKSLNHYVNDAIGFRMTPEQVLYFSPNAFGTADTISFRDNLLRIHDLKTGTTVTSMRQLHVYAALFCLEYRLSPNDIGIELRKYQLNDVEIDIPLADDIRFVMDKIILFDKRINTLNLEE